MAVQFAVPGEKFVFAQPTSNVCWATVYTMMISWKNQKRPVAKEKNAAPNIQAAITELGQPWLSKVLSNVVIQPAEGKAFETATNMTREPRMNLSPQGWRDLLMKFGLLWVTGVNELGSVHDRILEGINGDETGDGTEMLIIDPNGGRRYSQVLSDFIKGFEAQAHVEPFDSDYQILHFSS
jgi:hypothetical protein